MEKIREISAQNMKIQRQKLGLTQPELAERAKRLKNNCTNNKECYFTLSMTYTNMISIGKRQEAMAILSGFHYT